MNSSELDFKYTWSSGEKEIASYIPLQDHLTNKLISASIVSEGQDLPDKLLFREELWTLKKNVSLRSIDLRKSGEESVFRYIVLGRTDLVRTNLASNPLGKRNNRYFIEIRKGAIAEEALREAVIQLIGGNASNTFHSPPVVLTNLNDLHYVLYITLMGDPTVDLVFDLNVVKMPSFGTALAVVETQTSEMKSVTMHLGRKPTPPSTPPTKARVDWGDDVVNGMSYSFENVTLEEVVTEDSCDTGIENEVDV